MTERPKAPDYHGGLPMTYTLDFAARTWRQLVAIAVAVLLVASAAIALVDLGDTVPAPAESAKTLVAKGCDVKPEPKPKPGFGLPIDPVGLEICPIEFHSPVQPLT